MRTPTQDLELEHVPGITQAMISSLGRQGIEEVVHLLGLYLQCFPSEDEFAETLETDFNLVRISGDMIRAIGEKAGRIRTVFPYATIEEIHEIGHELRTCSITPEWLACL